MKTKTCLAGLLLIATVPVFARQTLSGLNARLDTIGNPSDKIGLIRQAQSTVLAEVSDSIRAEFYLRAGITYGIIGKADTSIMFFEQALNSAGPAQHLLKARSLNGIGNVCRQTGDNQRALESFQRAMDELENKTDADSRSFYGSVIANLSGIYFSMRDFEKAEQYNLRSLAHSESINDSAQMAYTYVGLGLIYSGMGKYDKSAEYHALAGDMIEKANIDYLRDYNRINFAKLEENRGDTDAALVLYEEIITGDNPDMDVRTTALINAGNIYFNRNDYEKSRAYALRLLDHANEMGLLPSATDAHQLLYKSYQAEKNYQQANEYLNRYLVLHDSLTNENLLRDLAELETRYESEKKAQEITQLKLENQQAANQRNIYLFLVVMALVGAVFLVLLIRSKNRANRLITASLKEKETLLREIHHRVKNNLQIISSLLSLQSRFIEDKSAKDAVNEGQNRVKSMALIHQKLYQNDNLSGVEALEYIENLTSTLRATYGVDADRVVVNYDVDKLNIDVDTIIPIGLILNELISNAFKHAFPDEKQGQITIGLKQRNNQLELKVSDNGVGGATDITQSDSFGIRMIRSLAMKLEATVDFKFSNGTEASLLISSFKLI